MQIQTNKVELKVILVDDLIRFKLESHSFYSLYNTFIVLLYFFKLFQIFKIILNEMLI